MALDHSTDRWVIERPDKSMPLISKHLIRVGSVSNYIYFYLLVKAKAYLEL